MALDKEQLAMVEIRKLVIENLKKNIEQDNVGNALNYMVILNDLPSYVEE